MPLSRVGRRVLVTFTAVVVAVVLVAVATVLVTVRRPLPDYSGTVQVPGLDTSATIVRDAHGIPQVYADSSDDLFFAQGYAHAQDRFFQMDYRRHVTAGRLSELVGANPDALAADTVIRTLGMRRVAEQELPLLSASTRQALQSYSDGVNAYLSGKSPADLAAAYSILGVKLDLRTIEPWTPVDSLAWLKAMAWDLKANYAEELGRGIAYSALNQKMDLVAQIFPEYPYDTHRPILTGAQPSNASLGAVQRATTGQPALPSSNVDAANRQLTTALRAKAAQDALAATSAALAAVPSLLGRGDDVGSNSWVVSGRLTATGKPLLANDPHLAPHLPSVWSQIGLHCRTVSKACPYDVAGFSFAGLPGVVIGHNATIAWGLTNLRADTSDFFLEETQGDSALRDGKWMPLTIRDETINVAGGDPVVIRVRSTRHGPLLSDAISAIDTLGTRAPAGRDDSTPDRGTGYSVSLAWTSLTPGRSMDSLLAFNTASSFEEFRNAAKLFDAPSQNLVYADTAGHIGYQAPGRIPLRPDGPGRGKSDGTWPRLGWDSSWDWKGYVPFAQLPWVKDPADGMIVTANQAVTPPGQGPMLSKDWDYGYRSQRIRDLLANSISGGKKLTTDDMTAIQADDLHPFAATLMPYLLAAPVTTSSATGKGPVVSTEYMTSAIKLLKTWDFRDQPDSAAAAFYNAIWSNLMRLTFADQLPATIPQDGGSRWFTAVAALLKKPNSPLWDDARTAGLVESRDQILGEAIYSARIELTAMLGKDPASWSWGKLHRLQLQADALGSEGSPAPVRWLFNESGKALGGGTSVVKANAWSTSVPRDYTVTAVPSMRMVVNLAALDESMWIDLVGVSGHPGSAHYADQLDDWARGRMYRWPFSAAAVQTDESDTLELRPLAADGGG